MYSKDWLRVEPPAQLRNNASIDTYEDHRIAMSFSLAALGGVTVRINDRGPFARNRVLDCSEAAARALGFHRKGLARVGIDWPRAALGSAGEPGIVVAQRSAADLETAR